MGGTKNTDLNTPANITAVCGHGTAGCHGTIEKSRDLSTRYGWLVRREDSPGETPLLYRGIWAYITSQGIVEYISHQHSLAMPNPTKWLELVETFPNEKVKVRKFS